MKRVLALAAVVLTIASVVHLSSARAATPVAAPGFTLKDLDGKTVRLSDYRGKAVVINFWATWCPPCRHEIPWFIDLQKQYGPHGLQIIGVSMDESGPAAVKKFADAMGVNYKVVMGDPAVARSFGSVRVLPTTIYIDRNGKIVSTVPGLISKQEIEGIIQRLLSSKKG